jgi:hypothetical protein
MCILMRVRNVCRFVEDLQCAWLQKLLIRIRTMVDYCRDEYFYKSRLEYHVAKNLVIP